MPSRSKKPIKRKKAQARELSAASTALWRSQVVAELENIGLRLDIMQHGSKEAREDNLATLPAIREAVQDCTQLMHLYQTHFEELVSRLSATNQGSGPMRAWHINTAAQSGQQAYVTSRAPCLFSHLHQPGIQCAVCKVTP